MEQRPAQSGNRGISGIIVGVVILIAILLCCLCLVGITVAGVAIYSARTSSISPAPEIQSTAIQVIPPEHQEPRSPEQTPTFLGATPTPGPAPTVDPSAQETLKTLEESVVPNNDLLELAERLKGIKNIPATLPAPAQPFKVGDQQKFWASNTDTNENFQVNATLRYITPHLYFWVEDGVRFDQTALGRLSDTFENKIYSTDREFFGSEWTPGVDSDPHLYILFANNLGGVLGYFSSNDEYTPEAHQYSNSHEMFFISAEHLDLTSEEAPSTLAHEFQHMIHWYRDRNEESWMNEGFSVLAEFLNQYTPYFDYDYIQDPDIQLTDWPNNDEYKGPHYGAGFLYLNYFLGRFGEKATQALVANPLNGLVSVDDVLAKDNFKDTATGKPLTANDIFADWVVANYLQDKSVGDGRYAYAIYPGAPQAKDTETVNRCPLTAQTRDVHQFGVDYIDIRCPGTFTLNFQGNTQVNVIPENPHSGQYAFWSNKGDESDMTLTRSFDFSAVSGPLTFKYDTWYDVEKDYDFVYLEAREEGGDWKILKTPSGTDSNISGNSYGWGYNGTSDGWKEESVDLSAYAGKKVELRFEYITDAAVNGEGFLLDDVSIPQAGYQTDFEKDDSGWQAAGFVRIQNNLPQTYRVSLILKGSKTTVQTIELSSANTASIPVTIGGNVDEAVLVVSGTTRFTRQLANYQYSVQK